ncbi:MAG: hypothetical protein CFE21_17110 [Bacteroidetes bacterium B1(2017)]|nr:MAG: hypothetical protein CFE21_17110 [Bacteroidetes bacterium B1(2017)]
MGTLNHTEAMGMCQTLGAKIDALKNAPMQKGGFRKVDKEVIEINMIINNVVSKTNDIQGFEVKKLHNGSVSSAYHNGLVNTEEIIYGAANDGVNSVAMANRMPGTNIITFNLQSWSSTEEFGVTFNPTVENLQNTYVHEAGGHFAKGLSHIPKEHAKVIEIQMKHSSWKNTTPIFKAWMNKVHDNYKDGKN